MQSYGTEKIRNIVFLSHGGAGKTSLSEALLFKSEAITRLGRVDDGTTTSDHDPDEVKRKMSINTSLLPCEWRGHKINILDTPGYADFVGEVKVALRVAEAGVVVVCAASGVEVGTELAWKYANESALPRLIFINKMDRENADFLRTMEQIWGQLGSKAVAVQLPIGAQSGFQGIVDLVRLKAFIGPHAQEVPVPPALVELVEEYRGKLLEAAAETDDDLIAKYLEGEEITEKEILQGLRKGTIEGQIVPVLIGSAYQNVGTALLLDALVDYAPSPLDVGDVLARHTQGDGEVHLVPRSDGPLAALVFKTTADPYVGKLSYLRVYSGTLASDSQVWNSQKGKAERLGQLLVLRGKTQEPVPQLVAGDIGAVAKLAEASTGDTLCSREQPFLLMPPAFPPPLFSSAVHPKTKADLDKMSTTLARLVEEDPTLRVWRDPDTHEIILSGIGESHVEVAVEKMRRKFGVDLSLDLPKVAYKETITVLVKAEYKHKKQTGGHGQYGHVFLELEPLPRGAGFEFAERVVGGVVPKNYIPSVEKGVREAILEGVLAHYPVVDVKATLFDGSYHPVDSSDISFQIAGGQAFKKGCSSGHSVLLEPVMNLRITVPESATGDIIGDLNGKRAKVLGMIPENGMSIIEAQAPLAEVLRYATDLRSLTQGRGTFTMEFSRYEEVPTHIAQRLMEHTKQERGTERE